MLKPPTTALRFTVALVCTVIIAGAAHGSENGMSTYPSGFQDTMAGVLPPPGWYVKEMMFSYAGSLSKVVREGEIQIDLHQNLPVQLTIVSQVTKTRLWNSYYSWALAVPMMEPKLTGQVADSTNDIPQSQRVSAISETEIIPIMLGWHNGRSHHKAFMVIYCPTGKYDLDDFVYTSLNHWAIEFDYAYTFFDPKTGYEFSAAPGYTFNTKNATTSYLSGQEFHVDLAALKHLNPKVGVGAVGYMTIQTTADTGAGAALGSFMGRAFALGPIVNYNTQVGSVPVSLTGKYYGEFGVTDQFAGHSYWLNITASF